MGPPRPMAIFATYRHLREHVVLVAPVASRDRIRAATVTVEACCKNGPAKSDVCRFISWRHLPRLGAGVKGERCLKEITAPSDDAANSICTRADDPFELMLLAENLCTIFIQRVFTFVQFRIPGSDVVVSVKPLIGIRSRHVEFFQESRRNAGHRGNGATHPCLHILSIDPRVTLATAL